MQSKVAVCILNYNGIAFLEQFLPGVVEHTPSEIAEVVIIDNCSTDSSLAFVRAHFPTVRIISNQQNLGFTGGYNHGLRHVKSAYYLLLNSDIQVTEGYLEPLCEVLDQDDQVAACQPKILAHHDKEYFEYAGAAGGFIDYLGYPFCRGRIFESLEKDEGQYDDRHQIFWTSGACMLVRASLFREIGGFDESFFAHMEEIDLCWRMQRLGYQIMYEPKSTVFHVGGGTLNKSNPRKTYYNFRNSASMLYKNTVDMSLYWKFPLKMFLDLLAGVKFGLDNSPRHFFAVWQAYFDFFSHLPKKRRTKLEISRRSTHLVDAIHPKLIAFQYYLGRKRKFSDLKA